jgi:hypothetical protein
LLLSRLNLMSEIPVNRRRLARNTPSTLHSLERALGSWVRLRDAWESIFKVARAVSNYERMALAESKLDECKSNITRLQLELELKEPAT